MKWNEILNRPENNSGKRSPLGGVVDKGRHNDFIMAKAIGPAGPTKKEKEKLIKQGKIVKPKKLLKTKRTSTGLRYGTLPYTIY